MKRSIKQFVVVDDDPQNNSLTKIAIRRALGDIPVTDFIDPDEGLEYIGKDFDLDVANEKVILLLDINMPTMSGWEFLEACEKFSDNIKKQFHIYMLSSSVDPSDIDRATSNPLVINFIEKPLNKTILEKMVMWKMRVEG